MENPDNVHERKLSILLYIIIGLLVLGIIALVIWMRTDKARLNSLLKEREKITVELQQELDSLMSEHEDVKFLYGALSDSLKVKDSVIQANAVEIKKLLNTEYEYYLVKKKLARLQIISQGYVRQMDSLYTINQALTVENTELREEVKAEQQKSRNLTMEKAQLTEKVEEASILRTYRVTAVGIRSKGTSKEIVTDKAKKVDKIKVCFTITQNTVIPAGLKTSYIRIA